MEHLTSTPFGRRPVTAGLIARAAATRQNADPVSVDKWSLFRDLTTARQSFDLGDRTLMVLNALLTFLPEKDMTSDTQMIVFPSNRTLSDRCHGMAESTLRRHLVALVEAGLIRRHDSPNGKRYARRGPGGAIARAFGFDLSPLLHRCAEITDLADESRRAKAALTLQRERISLMRRDALKLIDYGIAEGKPADWATLLASLDQLTKVMRRKLNAAELDEIEGRLQEALTQIQSITETKTEEMSGSAVKNERHYQNTNKDKLDSEKVIEKTTVTSAPPVSQHQRPTALPLPVVLDACPDILPYCDRPLQNWHDLIATASKLHGMMGIDHSAWDEAMRIMGAETAAITLACILQRFTEIRNPGGYLRSLSARAASNRYSAVPMVMALMNRHSHRAA